MFLKSVSGSAVYCSELGPRVCVYKSTDGLAPAASLAEKQLGVSSLHEPSKVTLTLLFYCTHTQMLAHHILQSVSFCTCSAGQDEFYLGQRINGISIPGLDKSDKYYWSKITREYLQI